MSTRRIGFERVPTKSVVLGAILLVGVLSMAYGYYQNNQVMLYVGMAVTILGALVGIVFLTILPNDVTFTRHRR